MQKPSVHAVAVVFAAAGETGFTAAYSMSMTRVRPTDGATPLQGLHSAAHKWSSIEQQRMSMDGHHVVWQGKPPSADSAVDLSFDAGKFSFSKTFKLSIELNCTAVDACIEDGDVVLTRVTAASASDGLVSEVMISTRVESLLSCDHSVAWVEGLRPDNLSVSAQSPMKVHVEAFDCDGRPINYTRSDLEFSFGGKPLSVTWSRGSNNYTADVPPRLTTPRGQYELVVSATRGWDSAGSRVTSCVLLGRSIAVVQEISDQIIVIGTIAGVLLLSLLLLMLFLVRSRQEEMRRMLISFMKHEAVLAVKAAWESWVRALALALAPSTALNASVPS